MERRLFHKPRRKNRIIKLTPPSVHKVPLLTGGLQQLYDNIREGCQPIQLIQSEKKRSSEFTDENGVFQPEQGMPLLAGRYQYKEVIGRGQSSVLIKAKDTFRSDLPVAIKLLHLKYAMLGNQETHCLACLNKSDPQGYSGTLRIYTTFMFLDHYCMVFEYLQPKPLHRYFSEIKDTQKLMKGIRQVAVHILKSLGFLQKQNIIHADLKPDNILLKEGQELTSLKLVDFGNAIRCVHEELRLYYEDFELQTLLYRAPEVMFGVHFGLEIDLWSLGCILAELYLGSPVFYGKDKESILQKMVSILGPVPQELFKRGKFYSELSHFTSASPKKKAAAGLKKALADNRDYNFTDFLARLLHYDSAKRMTIFEAIKHPFLAPEMPFRYFLPPEVDAKDYNTVFLDRKSYTDQPHISKDTKQLHMCPSDLLRHGTGKESAAGRAASVPGTPPSTRKVAQVVPLVRCSQDDNPVIRDLHIDLTTPPAQPASPDSVELLNGDLAVHSSATDPADRKPVMKVSPGSSDEPVAPSDRTFFVDEQYPPQRRGDASLSGRDGVGKKLQRNQDCDENRNIRLNETFIVHHTAPGDSSSSRHRHTGKCEEVKSDPSRPARRVVVRMSADSSNTPNGRAHHAAPSTTIPVDTRGHKIRRKLARQSASSNPGDANKTSNASQRSGSSSPEPKRRRTIYRDSNASNTNGARQGADRTPELSTAGSAGLRDGWGSRQPSTSPTPKTNVIWVTTPGKSGKVTRYGRVPAQSDYDQYQPAEHPADADRLSSPTSDVASSLNGGSSPSTASDSSHYQPSSVPPKPVLWDESSGESGANWHRGHSNSFTRRSDSGYVPNKEGSPSSDDDVVLVAYE